MLWYFVKLKEENNLPETINQVLPSFEVIFLNKMKKSLRRFATYCISFDIPNSNLALANCLLTMPVLQ